jgi:hypothetical protein
MFLEISMAFSNLSHAEEITYRLSVEIFDEEIPRSNSPNPYYQQNLNPPRP